MSSIKVNNFLIQKTLGDLIFLNLLPGECVDCAECGGEASRVYENAAITICENCELDAVIDPTITERWTRQALSSVPTTQGCATALEAFLATEC